MKTLFAASLAAIASANSVPIYGYYPGFVQGGNKLNISIEMFYDALCDGSAAQNTVMNSLLTTMWHGAPVFDQISLKITYFPLPYHYHTYQVTELVPYFMDLCVTSPSTCLFNQYKDYAFANVQSVLALTNLGRNDFITYWTTQVANEFGLDQATLENVYFTSSPYDVDGSSRDFFKFASSNGINGTPTAFINGAKLDKTPGSVKMWLYTLEQVYNSQFK